MQRPPEPPEADETVQPVGSLTEEEERALFLRYRRNPSEDNTNRILKQYGNLVYHIAHKYASGHESFDDLVQVGMIGLVLAIRRFEVEKGWRFSTYAYQTIRGEIQRHFRDRSWSLSVPRQLKERSLKVFAAESVLALKLGCSPTAVQVAAETGLTEEQVQEAMELGSAYHPMNILEEAVSAEGDLAGQPPSVGMEGVNQDLFWEHILSFLSENEAAVIRLRFWDGLPQREVAVYLGTSQMNVSRIQRNALAKLRKVMRHSGLPDE